MRFTTRKLIRFQHCDPAGIVFYPRFFVLLHEMQEDFLAHIGFPEHVLIADGVGFPIIEMKTSFLGMCRHGDEITISLALTKIGNTSIGMHYEIHGAARGTGSKTLRLRAQSVVVCSMLPEGKPVPIPEKLRSALLPYLQVSAET